MCNLLRTFLTLSAFINLALPQDTTDYYPYSSSSDPQIENQPTEHPGGTVINDRLVFTKSRSPYWLRNDLIIERNAEVVIEPGVTIKVQPQIGITVRGTLTAEVSVYFVKFQLTCARFHFLLLGLASNGLLDETKDAGC